METIYYFKVVPEAKEYLSKLFNFRVDTEGAYWCVVKYVNTKFHSYGFWKNNPESICNEIKFCKCYSVAKISAECGVMPKEVDLIWTTCPTIPTPNRALGIVNELFNDIAAEGMTKCFDEFWFEVKSLLKSWESIKESSH